MSVSPQTSILDPVRSTGVVARLDPRGRIILAALTSLILAVSQAQATALLGLGLGLVTVALAGIKPATVLRRLVAVNVFTAMLWVLLPIRLEVQSAWPWLAATFNPAGLDLALAVTLKVNAIFLATLGLLGVGSVQELLHGLAHLRLPAKLVALLFLFHRYLFVIHQEYVSLREAMAIRGFSPRTNPHTYASYANLLGMLMARSLDRAERVLQAMLCRGFDGTFWVLDHFHWQGRDTCFSVLYGLGLVGLVLVERGYF